jgi:acyl-CoA synthetase (AMP-forming)/AMP-acid ligase II/3-hydroxymyristoyl/3-hydroxydecanoyl-(acyl carrier protein) dehydratase
MSDQVIALSHCVVSERQSSSHIAYHAGHYYSAEMFYTSVRFWVKQLQQQPFKNYALFTEDAYPFAVLLFALFHAGKQVWLAGNNRPGTAQQLKQYHCQLIGDWEPDRLFNYNLSSMTSNAFYLSALNLEETRLVIFTSASTGEAKPIYKCLLQLQNEIDTLQRQWGERLGQAEVLSTVSHQHIYGLLFRVLWPLSVGRCFHSQIYINPETLVNCISDVDACWVASPAHLKRLDQNSPWQQLAQLNAIFSSGGVLNEVVSGQINTYIGQWVIEVYGSSETGGIGWRDSESVWQLFEGLRLSYKKGGVQLHSPYLITHESNDGFQLDDQISILDERQFVLHGRLDRIVKIEEKRLSLSELESRLTEMPWIIEVFTVVIVNSRDVVCAAVILNDSGFDELKTKGRIAFIKNLRQLLTSWFDRVVLPRKWLFLDSMPMTTQGKIDQYLLKTLLEPDTQKLPLVQSICTTATDVEISIKIPKNLVYFPDHFSSYPILPGVIQIAWVEYFGKLFFVIDEPFLTMEVIKFIKTIRPNDELKLILSWDRVSGKLHFNFHSQCGEHSSGRLIYAK